MGLNDKKINHSGSFIESKYKARPVRAERGDYMTQKEMILDYMRQTGGITAAEAMKEIGCYRLAARIADIRADGIDVKAEPVRSRNRWGKSVRFVRYSV